LDKKDAEKMNFETQYERYEKLEKFLNDLLEEFGKISVDTFFKEARKRGFSDGEIRAFLSRNDGIKFKVKVWWIYAITEV